MVPAPLRLKLVPPFKFNCAVVTMTLLLLATVTRLSIVVVAEPLVEMPTAPPLRLRVVGEPPELVKTKFCPAVGAMVIAPPAVVMLADEAEGD